MEWLIGFFILWLISEITGNNKKPPDKFPSKKELSGQEKNPLIKKSKSDLEEVFKKTLKKDASAPTAEISSYTNSNKLENSLLDEKDSHKKEKYALPRESEVQISDVFKLIYKVNTSTPAIKILQDISSQKLENSSFGEEEFSEQEKNALAQKATHENRFSSSLNKYGITSLWHITHRENIATILSKGNSA